MNINLIYFLSKCLEYKTCKMRSEMNTRIVYHTLCTNMVSIIEVFLVSAFFYWICAKINFRFFLHINMNQTKYYVELFIITFFNFRKMYFLWKRVFMFSQQIRNMELSLFYAQNYIHIIIGMMLKISSYVKVVHMQVYFEN